MRGVWMMLLWAVLCAQGCTYYFGNSWKRSFAKGGDQPYLDMGSRPAPLSDSLNAALGVELLNDWAKETAQYANWPEGRIGVPRIILTNLMLRRNIDSTNRFIQTIKASGTTGSTWLLNKKGDYDFGEIIFADILMRFVDQPEILYPASAKHIADYLIIDEGKRPANKTPRTLRIMSDTENHILMREVSRYCKLEYLRSVGLADSATTRMERWLEGHLEDMLRTGYYEFNAQPYIGYTITAIEVLYNNARNPRLKMLSQQLLDKVHLDYILGSYALQRYPPYRRRLNYSGNKEFANDPHTSIMQALLWKYEKRYVNIAELPYARHQSVMAWASDYQLPDTLYKLITQPREPYLALIGHGKKASPEIYSGGPGFLISAGGVQRGKASQLVVRPIVLFVRNGVGQLDSVIYLRSTGPMKRWNLTGVYDRFAVSDGGAYIPANLTPLAEGKGWQIVQPDSGLLVAVYSKADLGIMVVYDDWKDSPTALLAQINSLNPDPQSLYCAINLPTHETIQYNLKSAKNTWVIQPKDDAAINRHFDKWPGLRLIKR